MSDEVRSFPRWVKIIEGGALSSPIPTTSYDIRADLVVRKPETQDVDFPGVGAKMVDVWGTVFTVEGPPFVSSRSGCVFVPVNGLRGAAVKAMSDLRPFKPTKRYTAVYEGTDEADVRERFQVPEGVRLEEKP